MYEELIRVLRHCGNPNVSCKGCSDEDNCIGADGAWEIGAMANMRAAAEAIEELVATVGTAYNELANNEANKPHWVSVTERLPEENKYVLVRYANNDMAVACVFDRDEHMTSWRAMIEEGWCADCETEPTHWMPLPEPPEEEA